MNLIHSATAAFEALQVPAPIPGQRSQPFWAACARGVFTLQRCQHCGQWLFYPRGHCPHCWSDQLAWEAASGRGRLKTFSIVHRPGHPAWQAVAPYALGIIALAEGPSMLSTLLAADLASLRVGLPVQVRFVRVGDYSLPMFEPCQEAAP